MNASLKVTMDNAAFYGNELGELARILRTIAGKLDAANEEFSAQLNSDEPCYKYEVVAKDTNGNTVGWLEIE